MRRLSCQSQCRLLQSSSAPLSTACRVSCCTCCTRLSCLWASSTCSCCALHAARRGAPGGHPELPAAARLPGGRQRLQAGVPQPRGAHHRVRHCAAGPTHALHVILLLSPITCAPSTKAQIFFQRSLSSLQRVLVISGIQQASSCLLRVNSLTIRDAPRNPRDI